MRHRLEVLLAGRSREELIALENILSARGDVRVATQFLVNGHADPLHNVFPLPDALVLVVSQNWQAELAALRERPGSGPALLVVGEADNAELIRVAMRAGAKDFLSPPVDEEEIRQFIAQLLRNKHTESSRRAARLTAVINAKGGAGASMVAANLAHAFSESMNQRTLLMDLDVQFGTLPLYFNLTPRNGLVRALELVDSLDLLALEGYVLSHSSGLDLLASAPEDRLTVAEVPEERVEMLLNILGEAYDDIVVDVPRWVSGATAMTLEHADHVLIVLEQGVTHLRDAQQLATVLRSELNVGDSQLTAVVNRFNKTHPVSLKDIQGGLPGTRLVTLPNDYKRVSQSVNAGSPLLEFASGAPVTRSLANLARSLGDAEGQLRVRGSKWNFLSWAH